VKISKKDTGKCISLPAISILAPVWLPSFASQRLRICCLLFFAALWLLCLRKRAKFVCHLKREKEKKIQKINHSPHFLLHIQ